RHLERADGGGGPAALEFDEPEVDVEGDVEGVVVDQRGVDLRRLVQLVELEVAEAEEAVGLGILGPQRHRRLERLPGLGELSRREEVAAAVEKLQKLLAVAGEAPISSHSTPPSTRARDTRSEEH